MKRYYVSFAYRGDNHDSIHIDSFHDFHFEEITADTIEEFLQVALEAAMERCHINEFQVISWQEIKEN